MLHRNTKSHAYQCHICGKGYSGLGYVARHVAKEHPNVGNEEWQDEPGEINDHGNTNEVDDLWGKHVLIPTAMSNDPDHRLVEQITTADEEVYEDAGCILPPSGDNEEAA
jgi:hypothetical protein